MPIENKKAASATPSPVKQPGFEGIFAITGIVGGSLIALRRKK